MWAYTLTAPRTFSRVETATPGDLAPGQVLLRPEAGGICGSDIPFFRGRPSRDHDLSRALARDIPGFSLHEISGEVLAQNGTDLAVGDHVAGWVQNKQGLSERVVTEARVVAPYESTSSPVEAVVLQPLACVLDMVARLPAVESRRAAVVGLGPIGLMFAHALRDAGASHVIGVDPVERAHLSDTFGLDETIREPAEPWSRSLTEDQHPDIIIEAVGHQVGTLTDCIRAIRPGGTIFYFGVPDDLVYPIGMDRMFRKSITLMSGNVREHRLALERADAYAARHPTLLRDVTSHVMNVHDAQAAFDLADAASPERLKVVLEFAGPDL